MNENLTYNFNVLKILKYCNVCLNALFSSNEIEKETLWYCIGNIKNIFAL
jgi:hypothetical protein